MRGKTGYHGRSHAPGGSDPIAALDDLNETISYGFGVYLDGEPDTFTVPGDGDAVGPIVFGAEYITEGLTEYDGVDPSGWYLDRGVYQIFASLEWDNSIDIGYEKWFWISGLTLLYVAGSRTLNLESVDVIPDNSTAYSQNIALSFVHNDPSFPVIPQLAAKQFSGSDLDVTSASMMVFKIKDLP